MSATTLLRPTKLEVDVVSNDKAFEMRKSDWRRIKRLIRNMPERSKFLSITYSIFLGFALSSVLTIINVHSIENLEPWIIPFHICLTSFSFVFSITLIFLDKKKAQSISRARDEINTDIQEIEALYK